MSPGLGVSRSGHSRAVALEQELSVRLRRRRLEIGLSQSKLAERVDVSAEFISRLERGATLPSLPTLMRLCSALGCSPDDLLVGKRKADRFEQLRDRLERA